MSDSNGQGQDQFDFDSPDLAPRTMPVKYRGVEYELREATESAAIKYRDTFITRAKFNDEGKFSGVGAISEGEALLVSMCLYEKLPNGQFKIGPDGRDISCRLEEIKGWPAKVVKPLFNWVRKNSDLVEQPDTPEELEDQISKLQQRLVKVRRGEKDGPKGRPSTGADTSD